MPSQHTLHVPTNATHAQPQQPGCGCCQHCQCTGRCVGREATTPEANFSISKSHSALTRSGSSKPVILENEPGDDHYSALESALHPGDAIPLPQNLCKYVTAQDKSERGPTSRRDTSSKVSRDLSPGSKWTSQEEYEAGYAAQPRRHHRRLKGKTELGGRPNDDEREMGEDGEEKRHGKEQSNRPREERKKPARHAEKDEGDSKEDSSIGDEKERQVEETKEQGSIRSDLSSQSERREGKSDLPSYTADFLPSKARPRREIIKEIRALVREATVIPTSGNHSTLASLCSATLTQTDVITKGRHVLSLSEDGGGREEQSSLRVIRKLTVHVPTEYGLTLHFLDWSRRNERDEPLVAYRLQDGEQGPVERRTAAGSLFTRKQQGGGRGDWLQESHDTGSKVAGKLTLGVGVKGPPLYHIDVKRRKVDKLTVTSADERDVPFADDPFFGSYTDHRHLYFTTPNDRTMKWHTVEPDRLMRLYGRDPDNYDIVYAEARMHRGEGRKNRGAKEVQLVFFDPDDAHQPHSKRRSKEQSKSEAAAAGELDIAHLCATWWCARQTFDESRLVEAHAEVAFIETIEKAFEVDLLAGA